NIVYELKLSNDQIYNATTRVCSGRFFLFACINATGQLVQKVFDTDGFTNQTISSLDNTPPENELKTSDGSIFVIYRPPNVTAFVQSMDQNLEANVIAKGWKFYWRASMQQNPANMKAMMFLYTFIDNEFCWKRIKRSLTTAFLSCYYSWGKWNAIVDDGGNAFEKDVDNNVESDDDDQAEIMIINSVKATEAIESFNKAIAWAEDNTTDDIGIQ
ncbi:unnamed protein product, partial [Ceratitis capitata]